MITDADITKLKKVFVTKQELKSEIDRVIKYVDYKTDRLENSILSLTKEFNEFKEQTAKSLDWLVGAFKKFDIDNHEIRITTLEKKPS